MKLRDYQREAICKIEDCDSSVKSTKGSQGMCGKHAQRVRRYGDPHYVTPENIRRDRQRESLLKTVTAAPGTYKKLNGRHEHRVVVEEKIGRTLSKGEVVHHIDHDKHNNHPDNLEVMTQGDHMNLHRKEMQKAKRKFDPCKACGAPHSAKGFCNPCYQKDYRARKKHV